MRGVWEGSVIEEVRARIDIVEVVSDHVLLKKAGQNYLGLCPFHLEKTPSFTVSPDKQLFYCFGCHAGGDVFSFLMKKEGMTFPEALEYLSERAGVPLPEAKDPEHKRRASIKDALEVAAHFYEAVLQKSRAAERARSYLRERGLGPDTVERFGIGYAPGDWDALIKALRRKRVPNETMVSAGLASEREPGVLFDRFRNRIMFPIKDVAGRVVGFGGRALEEGGPKYLNSPETPVFKKGKCLFALDLARESIRASRNAVVVEGYMDAISAHQAGLQNVVAPLGTALTMDQGRLLKRYASEVLMAYDADAAGEAATLKGLDVLNALGCRAKVAMLPAGNDPDDILRQGGGKALERLLDEAVPFVEYRLRLAMEATDTQSVEGKVKASAIMVPVLSRIKNAVEQSSYISLVAARLGIEEAALRVEVERERTSRHKKSPGRHNRVGNTKEGKKTVSAGEKAESNLIRLMIQHPDVILKVRDSLGEGFEVENYRAIAGVLYRLIEEGKAVNSLDVLDLVSEEEGMLITRIAMEPIEYNDPVKAVEDCLGSLERHKASRRLREIQRAIRQAEAGGNLPDAGLLEEYHRIVKRLKGSA